MGKYKKGILGFFRGTVGTVVGSVWNGIHYMKSLPDVGDDNPTPAQLNVRAKLSLVTKFMKRLKALINVGYQDFTRGITPMNAATSYHLKNAVTGTSSLNYAIDYSKVIFSVGDLPEAKTPLIATAVASQLAFSWIDDTLPSDSISGTHRATVLAYSIEKDKFTTFPSAVPRSAETYVLQLPLDWSGDEVHAWIAFVSINGKEVSNSTYIGQITIL